MANTKQNLLIVALILFTGSLVEAASYQKKDGGIVDPILNTGGSTHPYSGPNLEPNVWLDCCVDLSNANLTNANLGDTWMDGTDLSNTNLSGAFMGYANLTSANLSYADLTGANMGKGEDLTCETCSSANLSYANLTGADLTDANLTESLFDNAIFSTNTVLYDGQTISQWAFDESGLQTYLEGTMNAFGASNLTIVPEPNSLILLAMSGLLMLRRCAAR